MAAARGRLRRARTSRGLDRTRHGVVLSDRSDRGPWDAERADPRRSAARRERTPLGPGSTPMPSSIGSRRTTSTTSVSWGRFRRFTSPSGSSSSPRGDCSSSVITTEAGRAIWATSWTRRRWASISRGRARRSIPGRWPLAGEGATDEETFKSWGRAYQVPTQVFYSAHSDLDDRGDQQQYPDTLRPSPAGGRGRSGRSGCGGSHELGRETSPRASSRFRD